MDYDENVFKAKANIKAGVSGWYLLCCFLPIMAQM